MLLLVSGLTRRHDLAASQSADVEVDAAQIARREDMAVALSADAEVEVSMLGSNKCCCAAFEDVNANPEAPRILPKRYHKECVFVAKSLWGGGCDGATPVKVQPRGDQTAPADCAALNAEFATVLGFANEHRRVVDAAEHGPRAVVDAAVASGAAVATVTCRQCVHNPKNKRLQAVMTADGRRSWDSDELCQCNAEDEGAGKVTTCGMAVDFYACSTTSAMPKCNMCSQGFSRDDLPWKERERKNMGFTTTTNRAMQCECADGTQTTCEAAKKCDRDTRQAAKAVSRPGKAATTAKASRPARGLPTQGVEKLVAKFGVSPAAAKHALQVSDDDYEQAYEYLYGRRGDLQAIKEHHHGLQDDVVLKMFDAAGSRAQLDTMLAALGLDEAGPRDFGPPEKVTRD